MKRDRTKPLMVMGSCGHEIDAYKQSSMELCPACVAAIPKLRDNQTGLSPLALRRMAKMRRYRK